MSAEKVEKCVCCHGRPARFPDLSSFESSPDRDICRVSEIWMQTEVVGWKYSDIGLNKADEVTFSGNFWLSSTIGD
jgi:hypothetical protein